MGKGGLEDLCVRRRIILKLILEKMDGSLWTRIIWFVSEVVAYVRKADHPRDLAAYSRAIICTLQNYISTTST